MTPTKRTADDRTSATQQGERQPPLPHERDESTSTTPAEPSKEVQQAHRDLKRGLRDTDRGPVMDETYRKQKKG